MAHGLNCYKEFGLSFLKQKLELEENLDLPDLEPIIPGISPTVLKISARPHENSSWKCDPVGDA